MRLLIDPPVALADETPRISVMGAAPASRLRLTASFVDDRGQRYASQALLDAGPGGHLDVARAWSVGGTYEGIDARGPFWSAAPCAAHDLAAWQARRRRDASAPGGAAFDVMTAPVHWQFVAEQLDGPQQEPAERCEASFTMLRIADGVRETRVHADVDGQAVRGRLFEPAQASATSPLALVFPGSSGGVAAGQAAMLASRGVVAFAQAVFNHADLGPALIDVPLERFEAGARWLLQHRGLPASARLGVLGASRGGELALLLASSFPGRFSAAVAYVPPHLVHGGFGPEPSPGRAAWLLGGRPVPHLDEAAWMSPPRLAPYAADARSMRPLYLAPWTAGDGQGHAHGSDAAIAIERSHAAVLLLSGQADDLWPSSLGAARVHDRLAAHRHPLPFEHVAYPGAGHWISRPSAPDFMASDGWMHPVDGGWTPLGGTPRANAAATADAFSRSVRWLHRHAAPVS
jgi:dienelactone hydrolase